MQESDIDAATKDSGGNRCGRRYLYLDFCQKKVFDAVQPTVLVLMNVAA